MSTVLRSFMAKAAPRGWSSGFSHRCFSSFRGSEVVKSREEYALIYLRKLKLKDTKPSNLEKKIEDLKDSLSNNFSEVKSLIRSESSWGNILSKALVGQFIYVNTLDRALLPEKIRHHFQQFPHFFNDIDVVNITLSQVIEEIL